MGNHLPVGEGGVGCAIHSRKVLLAFGGLEWCAGQLLIFHRDPVASHRLFEGLEIVARDLMAEPSRSAVNHDDDLRTAMNAHGGGGLRIEKAIVLHYLDFEIVIAGPQCSKLIDSP